MRNHKTAAILLSRQHLRPSLKDEWVRMLKDAVAYVKSEGWMLGASVGTPNWDIITAAAVIENVSIKLFIPASDPKKFDDARLVAMNEFGLDGKAVEFESVLEKKADSTKKELWKYRDSVVMGDADYLIPISVRPNGIMSAQLQSAKGAGQSVIEDFLIKYDSSPSNLSYAIDNDSFTNTISKLEKKFIIHWTRTGIGPWPAEKKIEYYRAILGSAEYPRSAFDTLKRIIIEKLIMASSKNMPGKIATVSFSGLAPIDTIKLMKWRARYRQMSFEPYGIGIIKSTAHSIGIGEVQYYRAKFSKNSLSCPNWLTQSIGKITDWRNEEEFRYRGNFNLRDVPVEKLIAVCHHRLEAIELENKTGIKTVWFCD